MIELTARAVTKALGYTENGGQPTEGHVKAGKSGEMKSVFQFKPQTWHAYSKEVFGKDDVPLNSDNETYVVDKKVKQWIGEGKNIRQIASIWNAGNPNAYKEHVKGVNKEGVAYDTPAYADKVANYAAQFLKEELHDGQGQTATAQTPQSAPALQNVLSTINNTKSNTAPSNAQASAPSNGLLGGLIGQPSSQTTS